jgi:hypothetical protein
MTCQELGMLGGDYLRDKESRYHEEYVDADESTFREFDTQVIHDNQNDSDGTQAVMSGR